MARIFRFHEALHHKTDLIPSLEHDFKHAEDNLIKENSFLDSQLNEDACIWRYMSIAKFISLLESNKLYFTRLDKLNDKIEGQFFKDHFDILTKGTTGIEGSLTDYEKDRLASTMRLGNFTNCWHVNEYENYGMWNSYVKNEEGIVIKSTIKSLKDTLKKHNTHHFIIDKVVYVDFEIEKNMSSMLKLYNEKGCKLTPISALFKSKYYEFENEVRAVLHYDLQTATTKLNIKELDQIIENFPEYILADVDLKELIHSVYVHPNAPEWFLGIIQSITNKYDLEVTINKSNIRVNV